MMPYGCWSLPADAAKFGSTANAPNGASPAFWMAGAQPPVVSQLATGNESSAFANKKVGTCPRFKFLLSLIV